MHYFLGFLFQLMCTFPKIELLIFIKDMDLWNFEAKKMLTTWVISMLLCFIRLLMFIYVKTLWTFLCVCSLHCFSCIFATIVQAIKVLNMIKLYGKPIRVNKVLLWLLFFNLVSFKFLYAMYTRWKYTQH